MASTIALRSFGFSGISLDGYRSIVTAKEKVFTDIFYGVVAMDSVARVIHGRNILLPREAANGSNAAGVLLKTTFVKPFIQEMRDLYDVSQKFPEGRKIDDASGRTHLEIYYHDEIELVLTKLESGKPDYRIKPQAVQV